MESLQWEKYNSPFCCKVSFLIALPGNFDVQVSRKPNGICGIRYFKANEIDATNKINKLTIMYSESG
jgi:hypothetical protein